MTKEMTRREVLQSAALSGALVAGSQARAVAKQKANSDAETERVAELIMDASPDDVVHVVQQELKNGLSPKQLLASEFNAGMRFQGHHSAYVAQPIAVVSDWVAPESKMLPLFYYLSVLRFRARKPSLNRLDFTKLPSANRAEVFFHTAMTQGEKDDAALALIALSREHGAKQSFTHLWTYAAERNSASGGHTAVSVINAYRTLEATDWLCADAALHFAVADSFSPPHAGGVGEINKTRAKRVSEFSPNWLTGKSDRGATLELLDLYRTGQSNSACETTFELLLKDKVSASTVWDAIFLVTAELVIRYKWVGQKMLAGHSVTCTNALHYVFRTLDDPFHRLYAILESVEWATSFLARERARPALRQRSITELEPREADRNDAMGAIFSLLPPRRFASMARPGFDDVDKAMEMTFGWATRHADRRPFLDTALGLMCVKSTAEVHDFKFPMALFENCRYASSAWKPHLLAASVHVLQGTQMEDSPIVLQARD